MVKDSYYADECILFLLLGEIVIQSLQTTTKFIKDITSLHRPVEMKSPKDSDVDPGPSVPRITAILSYTKGFACSFGPGKVCLFEKIHNTYQKTKELQVKVQASFK